MKFSLMILSLLFSQALYGSVIERFRPGVEPSLANRNEHFFSAGAVIAENLIETPISIFYGLHDAMQLQVRWGLISNGRDIGVSDLKFGVKYNFFAVGADPMIFIDGGISLPAADHTKGLGTGGVGISMGWYISKKFENINAFFGITGEFNDTELLPDANPPRVFSYRLGGTYNYDSKTVLIGEIKGYNNYWNRTRGFTHELYLAPGIHYEWKWNEWKSPLTASLLIGLTDASKKIGVYAETRFGGTN